MTKPGETPRPAQGLITVLLPVGPGVDAARLGAALDSVARQTRPAAEILLLANGVTDAEAGALGRWCGEGGVGGCPTRLVRLGRAHLAGALNVGLREASTEFVARMDADDCSLATRFERQGSLLDADPTLAGAGCAWEVVGPDGGCRAVIRPPTDPRRLGWTLLLGNRLAHGSMLLRRSAVLCVGGYDESLDRAQDYDLWLRLVGAGHALAAHAEVLYRYTEATEPGVAASSEAQALAATGAMVEAWSGLRGASREERRGLGELLASALRAENGGGVVARLEAMLDGGATREVLVALLWARDRFPPAPRRALEVARWSRVREVAAAIRAAGGTRVWLWGAGEHTRWLLEGARADAGGGGAGRLAGLLIAGVVDDALAGQERFGHAVGDPRDLQRGEHVLLSSDWHEGSMWDSSEAHRARGVIVWRLYEDPGDGGAAADA